MKPRLRALTITAVIVIAGCETAGLPTSPTHTLYTDDYSHLAGRWSSTGTAGNFTLMTINGEIVLSQDSDVELVIRDDLAGTWSASGTITDYFGRSGRVSLRVSSGTEELHLEVNSRCTLQTIYIVITQTAMSGPWETNEACSVIASGTLRLLKTQHG